MAKYEEKTGGKLLAIPHNGNLSNGRMFELVDFDGNPLSKDYAERRARCEVLQEIMQTKGNSETHPTLSPNDEFADFGVAGWEYGNLTLEGEPLSQAMMPTTYLRYGLLRGLELEQKLGANPFKFGFVGGTDVHNSLTAIEEDNFFGKHVNQEPSPKRWEHVSKQGFGKTRYTWHYMAAGYAAVWATENTREALWDAMKRQEVYATSGSRMTVRFFGGWGFEKGDARSRHVADAGYGKGVPMGSDLPKAPAGAKAPSFLVAAMKDPLFGNLDRIQIVKGWLDKDGKGQEKVYDVAWGDADRRKVKGGKLAPGGRHRGRGDRHLDEHHRRPRAQRRSGRPRLRPVGARLLLRARHRDPDAALDLLRRGPLRHQDAARGPDEAPGAGLGLADLVHAGELNRTKRKEL